MTCNYCGSEEYDVIARYTRLERNNILQCKRCGLVYKEIRKNKEETESFYSSTEYRKDNGRHVWTAKEHFHNRVTQYDSERRIRFILNNISIKNKNVLEIGSASGSLLDQLKKHEPQKVIGIELDNEYSKFAEERGFEIFTCPIEELHLKREFDVVVSFHTLEHVYDPMKAINAVHTALESNGCFLGEVPNQDDWRIQIFDDEVIKRFHYEPAHYYYYSPLTLNNYLKASKFNKVLLETLERYNSIIQLKNILCNQDEKRNIEEILQKYIFLENENDEVRLPYLNTQIENKFNRVFENAVNSELMGNCLRWVAHKTQKINYR